MHSYIQESRGAGGGIMKNRNLRIKLNQHVELFWQGMKRHADIEDISVGGALIRTDIPVQVGDFMVMHLEGKSSSDSIEIGAEVIRTGHTRLNMPAFALQFLKIPEALRVLLRHSMAKHNATIGA